MEAVLLIVCSSEQQRRAYMENEYYSETIS